MRELSAEVQQCSKALTVDTSVFLHDPNAINFLGKDPENLVVIPLCVMEQIDHAKKNPGQKGFNARQVARILDEFRQKSQQSFYSGVRIGEGKGIVLIDYNGHGIKDLSQDLEDNVDNKILVIAHKWQKIKKEAMLVTKDSIMRLKADALGINTDDYREDKIVQNADELYTGWAEIIIPDSEEKDILGMLAKGSISASKLVKHIDLDYLMPNQCCEIRRGDKYQLAIYKKARGIFEYVPKPKPEENGEVKPVNDRQAVLLHLLQDPTIQVVTVGGTAGTGKSLISFLAGYGLFVSDVYDSLIIYKPIVEVGGERTLGFLPGDMQEKMEPWKLPIYDSLNLILRNEKRKGFEKTSVRDTIEVFLEKGTMEISPLSYIRGRSLSRSFVIVDEAQNLTPHEVKTAVTRLTKGSKMVLIGDVEQIDNNFLNATSNGLARAIEVGKDSEVTAHVTLTECRRIEAVALFASRM